MNFDQETLGLLGGAAVVAPFLVALISRVYKTVRSDTASVVGLQSDAQRIKDLQEALNKKELKLEEKDSIITRLVNDKSDLSSKVNRLETELSHALDQIAYLTNLVEYLVKQSASSIPVDLIVHGSKFHAQNSDNKE